MYLAILILVDAATGTNRPKSGPNNSVDSTLTATPTTSDSASRQTEEPLVVSDASGALFAKEGSAEMPSEKALRDADQAMESMHPATSSVTATSGVIMSVSAAVESVADMYSTWGKAVESIKQVLDVVGKITKVIAVFPFSTHD